MTPRHSVNPSRCSTATSTRTILAELPAEEALAELPAVIPVELPIETCVSPSPIRDQAIPHPEAHSASCSQVWSSLTVGLETNSAPISETCAIHFWISSANSQGSRVFCRSQLRVASAVPLISPTTKNLIAKGAAGNLATTGP